MQQFIRKHRRFLIPAAVVLDVLAYGGAIVFVVQLLKCSGVVS